MKQQNFLFVDLVSSIFLLILLIGNFLGLLYITEGNIVLSLLGSMFLVICYFFVVHLLKKNKEAMIKQKYIHSSLLFWVYFVLLSFVSFILMSHFINVEYNCKEHIRSEARQKINLVDSIAMVYKKRAKDDVQTFNTVLKTKLIAYKTTGNNILRNELATRPYSIGDQVLNNRDYINVDEVANANVYPMNLRIENNIKNIDSTIKENSETKHSIFENWKRLSLVGGYAKLNEYVEENLRMINSKLADLPLNRSAILLTYNKNQLPLSSPSVLNRKYPPDIRIPLMAILVIHMFVLIPFFTEKIRGGYGKKQILDPLEIENVRII